MSLQVGAIAIGDLVKTTLGPKGMDKILQSMQSEKVSITNDGATILKSIYTDNPAAKVLVELSKSQDDEVGDGTTSVVVFAGELLRQAEYLVNQKVHPMTIIQGFREACTVAKEALEGAVKGLQNLYQELQGLEPYYSKPLSQRVVFIDPEPAAAEVSELAVSRLRGLLQRR